MTPFVDWAPLADLERCPDCHGEFRQEPQRIYRLDERTRLVPAGRCPNPRHRRRVPVRTQWPRSER